jgi:hypothetical protein
LAGKIAEAFMANATALLAKDPIIENIELIAVK